MKKIYIILPILFFVLLFSGASATMPKSNVLYIYENGQKITDNSVFSVFISLGSNSDGSDREEYCLRPCRRGECWYDVSYIEELKVPIYRNITGEDILKGHWDECTTIRSALDPYLDRLELVTTFTIPTSTRNYPSDVREVNTFEYKADIGTGTLEDVTVLEKKSLTERYAEITIYIVYVLSGILIITLTFLIIKSVKRPKVK